MEEIMMVRTSVGLTPATEHDRELFNQAFAPGEPVKVKLTEPKKRSYQFHKLYYGGLLGLVKHYWVPQTGLVQPIEERTINGFCEFLGQHGISLDAQQNLAKHYMHNLHNRRIGKIAPRPATTGEIHRWVKNQLGYYDTVRLPDGTLEREPHSISFAKMDQKEFEQFYKKAVDLLWDFVLCQKFPSREAANNAMQQMMQFAA